MRLLFIVPEQQANQVAEIYISAGQSVSCFTVRGKEKCCRLALFLSLQFNSLLMQKLEMMFNIILTGHIIPTAGIYELQFLLKTSFPNKRLLSYSNKMARMVFIFSVNDDKTIISVASQASR